MAQSPEQLKLNASLRQAARVGDMGWTRELLKSGAEIDSGDKGTALYIAAKNGRFDLCNILLENGAKVNGEKKHVPLCAATEEGHLNTLDLLLQSGADLNCKDGRGRTPLYIAAQKGIPEFVVKLSDSGANPNDKNDIESCVPLHIASANGFRDIVKFLIERGADLNVTDRWKETPLHHACKDGHKDVAKLLLEAGANKEMINGDKLTPLALAKKNGREDIVDLINNFVPFSQNARRSLSVKFEIDPPKYRQIPPETGESSKQVEVPETSRLKRRSVAVSSPPLKRNIQDIIEEPSSSSRRSLAKRPVTPQSYKPDEVAQSLSFSEKRLKRSVPERKARDNIELSVCSNSSTSGSSYGDSDSEESKDTNFKIAYLTYRVLEIQYDLNMLYLDKLRVEDTNESFKKVLNSVRELCDLSVDDPNENHKWTIKKREMTFKLKENVDKEASIDDQIKMKESELRKMSSQKSKLKVKL